MSDNQEEQRAQRRRQRERQYEIDRITFQYAEEFRAGRSPRIEDYADRHPEFAAELAEFALYFHAVTAALPEPPATPATQLSPAAQKALARIREAPAGKPTAPAPAQAPATQPLDSLFQQGQRAGLMPTALADAIGVSMDVLGKLEAHAIAAATIPRTLLQRLASTLKVSPEAIAAFLGGATPQQASAFFYAEKPPTQAQQSFVDAIHESMLPPERKQEWIEIARRDLPGT